MSTIRDIDIFTCSCGCTESHKNGGYYKIVDNKVDWVARTHTITYRFVSDEEIQKNREECERLAKEEEIKRLETQIKILKLGPNECLVPDNQQLYDALLVRAKDAATPAAEKRGCRRAATEVRKFATSWFEDDGLWEDCEVIEEIACQEVYRFMVDFAEGVEVVRRKAGTGGY